MALGLYMDQHVPRAITIGLRLQGIDVITAHEDNSSELDDPALLDRASELGRVIFTRDSDFLVEATKRQRDNIEFGGIIYAHQLHVSIGKCIEDLEIIVQAGKPDELINKVIFLPL